MTKESIENIKNAGAKFALYKEIDSKLWEIKNSVDQAMKERFKILQVKIQCISSIVIDIELLYKEWNSIPD